VKAAVHLAGLAVTQHERDAYDAMSLPGVSLDARLVREVKPSPLADVPLLPRASGGAPLLTAADREPMREAGGEAPTASLTLVSRACRTADSTLSQAISSKPHEH